MLFAVLQCCLSKSPPFAGLLYCQHYVSTRHSMPLSCTWDSSEFSHHSCPRCLRGYPGSRVLTIEQLSTGVRHKDKKRIKTRQRLVFYTSDLKLHNQILAGGVATLKSQVRTKWTFPETRGASSPVTTFCWMPSFQDPWQVLSWRLGDHGWPWNVLEMSRA